MLLSNLSVLRKHGINCLAIQTIVLLLHSSVGSILVTDVSAFLERS